MSNQISNTAQSLAVTEKLIVEPHRFIYEGPRQGSGLGVFGRVVNNPTPTKLKDALKTYSREIGEVRFNTSLDEGHNNIIAGLEMANLRKNTIGILIGDALMDSKVKDFRREQQAALQKNIGKDLSYEDLEEIRRQMEPYNIPELLSVQISANIQSTTTFPGAVWVERTSTFNTTIRSKKHYVSIGFDIDNLIEQLRNESILIQKSQRNSETKYVVVVEQQPNGMPLYKLTYVNTNY